MSEATELTKNEQSLINKLEEETKNTSGGLPSYVATISENVGSAIELNNELSKRYGNTPISLHDLRKAGNFKNIMCSSSILGSALGMFPSTIEFNDALTSDIKNSRIDDTARVGLKVVVGIGIGAILLPYAAGAATVGVAAVGSAMVGYLSALAGNIIDESWEAGKDYLKDLWSQLETRLNDFRNTLSPELQTVFDQCANPVFEGLQVCPTSLNALQTVLQNNYSDELNKAANNLGLNQCPLPQNKMDKIDELMDTAEKTKSPLIVDLDGDGIETVGVSEGVYFDHDGNGFAEKSGWVGKDDGLLVRDINGNGQIDDGTELFGNNSVLSSGAKAANGFEALKELDSNKDGVFNSSDEVWNEIKVWKDMNQNGFVENGELLSMEEVNIKEINLSYQNENIKDINENIIGQTGSFIKNDNSAGNISDIWFVTDTSNTADRTDVVISDNVKKLPDLIGFGNVHNLHTAMALDESGELKALVEQFMSETNVSARNALLNDIIYHWAGVEDMDPFGRTPSRYNGTHYLDDARKLEALEEFMGRGYLGTWCWGERDPNPNRHAVLFIHDAFDELKEYVKNELLSQTHYKTLLEKVTLTYDAATESWDIDVSQAVAAFEEMFAADVLNTTLMMREFSEIIRTYTDLGDEIIAAFNLLGDEYGDIFERELFKFGKSIGTDGNDIIKDDDFGSIITGLGGNDKLYGNGGDDTIIGGAGNDYMAGGDGEDVYLFSKGFGNDEINTLAADGKKDVIEFDETIMPSNVSIGRQDFDLILTITYDDGTLADSIRVHSYFQEQGTSSATLAAIKFSDGTSWDYEYAITHWNSIPGIDGGVTMEGNDKANNLNGTAMDDILVGNGGNDTLRGNAGNDVLKGGSGNDYLDGGEGNDTYIWNYGDGFDTIYDTSNNDTIVFGKGISFRDLVFRSVGQTLLILVDGDEQQGVKISSFFYNINNKIENLRFYDGTIVHLSDIGLTLQQTDAQESVYGSGFDDVIHANGGDDVVWGKGGNDIIYGGAGDDDLRGEGGNDELYGGAGDDNLYGGNGDDILFGGAGNDDMNGEDGRDIYLYNLGDGLDTIYDGASSKEEGDVIRFGEGISLDDITFETDGSSLKMILNGDETQGLILQSFFNTYDDNAKNKVLEFADGSQVMMNKRGYELVMTKAGSLTATNYDDIIHVTEESSRVWGKGGNDIIYGGAGDDDLRGEGGNDELYGGAGDDNLYGGNGDDILFGGAGNDDMNGEDGRDIYLYNLGDGLDTIYDGASSKEEGDVIRFGEGISLDDITFETDGSSLKMILNGDETQGLILQSFFNTYDDNAKNKVLEFADGSQVMMNKRGYELVMTKAGSLTATNYDDIIHVTEESSRVWGKGGNDIIYGGAGDDDLRGEGGNDELYGGAGDDNLYGGNGDDILFGGAGNDDMNGEDGRDIYLYNLGDGLDTIYDGASSKEEGDVIRFGEGISLDDITFETDGSSLKMILNGDETQGLILQSFFNTYDDNAKNKVLEFADGTKINLLTNPPSLSSQNASDLLTQALSTFGADSGSRTDMSEAGGTVSEMYDLACGYDLTKKAV